MATNFEAVYPAVVRWATVRRLSDELTSIALVLAWWLWSNRRVNYPPSHWARLAVRQALAGRDLPGVQASKFRDVWDHFDRWGGAGMEKARDRGPGPERIALWREEYARVKASLSGDRLRMAELIEEDQGLGTGELAELLGKTPGRISQMRREIAEAAQE